jgi:hypothetical protein
MICFLSTAKGMKQKMDMKRASCVIFILFLIMAPLAGCAGTPGQPANAATQTPALLALSPGLLPENAAKALDSAIRDEYCSSSSFTAKSLRMMGSMKGVPASDYVEIQSTSPGLPLNDALQLVAPANLTIRGRADGTDISIVNYEEMVFLAGKDTGLGGYLVPEGARLVRENSAWVLVASASAGS